MKLIVNADDFGYSKGINLGIIEAFQHGVVRSTTMMANMPGFDHAVTLYNENPGLGVGVHLTLTCGRPLTQGLKTLVDANGNFHKLPVLNEINGTFDPDELEKEYHAQIEKTLKAGIHVTHLDSHHHTHPIGPMFKVFIKLAKEYGLPVRMYGKSKQDPIASEVKSTDDFNESFYADGVTFENFKKIITDSKGNSLEMMCHTAFVDHAIYHGSSYALNRIEELHILTSDEVKNFVKENNIELINFTQL